MPSLPKHLFYKKLRKIINVGVLLKNDQITEKMAYQIVIYLAIFLDTNFL